MAAMLCRLAMLIGLLAALCRPVQMLAISDMRTFSNAIKGGHFTPNEEYVLYESDTGEPGVITEQWHTGQSCMNENTTIRIYIDGEQLPSIEYKLLLGHGIGFVDGIFSTKPWNPKRISVDATHGIFNNYQIPFLNSFRVTATDPHGGTFWYIIRGVYNYPLMFGNLQLPNNTRLRLYKKENVTLKPFEFMDLVDIQQTAGVLFQVTLAAKSSDFQYLEGCMRAYIDGSNKTTWLSSGTEDFFLSASYFSAGIYHSDNSGLTYYKQPGTMSAYKFFENDPVFFSKSFRLRWRCGEVIGMGVDECPNQYLGSVPKQTNTSTSERFASPFFDVTVATTYTWIYEW